MATNTERTDYLNRLQALDSESLMDLTALRVQVPTGRAPQWKLDAFENELCRRNALERERREQARIGRIAARYFDDPTATLDGLANYLNS